MDTINETTWDEEDWDRLLKDIKEGRVIPVVGEELYTVPKPGGGETPLYHAAAQRLATALRVDPPTGGEQERPLNEVMRAYIRYQKARGRDPDEDHVCRSLYDAIRELDPQPSEALKNIAAISGFKLLVTTTPDETLERALNEKRFGGKSGTTSLAFQLKENKDLPKEYESGSPTPYEPPVVYHLFGRLIKQKDRFVISDDDLLEFYQALQGLKDEEIPKLRYALKEQHLLFLGGSMSDWLVRFLLRAMNGCRFSKKEHYDVVAAAGSDRSPELLNFLRFFSRKTMLAPYDAKGFVAELHRRWVELYPEGSEPAPTGLPMIPPPDQMADGCVFISYASEDRDAVRILKAHLDDAGIIVWFDRDQLKAGHDWQKEIERNLESCSFFVPVISRNTERRDFDAYFREEWYQANLIARRSYSRVEFVMPVFLERLVDPKVPESFMDKQRTIAPEGVPPEDFVTRLKALVEQYKLNPSRRKAS